MNQNIILKINDAKGSHGELKCSWELYWYYQIYFTDYYHKATIKLKFYTNKSNDDKINKRLIKITLAEMYAHVELKLWVSRTLFWVKLDSDPRSFSIHNMTFLISGDLEDTGDPDTFGPLLSLSGVVGWNLDSVLVSICLFSIFFLST